MSALLPALLAVLLVNPAPAPHRVAESRPVARLAPSPGVYRWPTPKCAVPAPTTADGYRAMFAKVDPGVWGAGDTALSVPMPDGRSVWLYSDTAAGSDPQHWTRFVHSTAIVQTGGCLRVSRAGAQVLPNEADGRFYWIDSASALDASHLRVLGYELSPAGAWTGKFRAAAVALSAAGDLTFTGWLGYVPPPTPSLLVKDFGIMGNTVSYNGAVICDPVLPAPSDQYTYSPQLHREARMASGRVLMSLAVGWVSGTPSWADLRPIYREVTLP